MQKLADHLKNPARDAEPMWPAFLALVAIGGLNLALPASLLFFPRYSLISLMAITMLVGEFYHRRGKHSVCRVLGYVSLAIVTVALVWSVILLIHAIPLHLETPVELLRSAMALWTTNILVFATWYWRLDAGGPHRRDAREEHDDGAFLFPQMTLPQSNSEDGTTTNFASAKNWSPRFVDYLFLAFNTSTALSPTDVPVLSRWAKGLMMVQSTISLAVIALLAARAVNIL
ncbi:MAG: hypothetical protein JSS86_01260 [Cyanobacteria bacterium SZAS LIN-2]|nr:hypothetical protein [Cyanobacteria bacterium SZAS LIN-3]MBS1994900.1 hypothetical protein [Cyanobacteria bacterium SZAS LIN-2]